MRQDFQLWDRVHLRGHPLYEDRDNLMVIEVSKTSMTKVIDTSTHSAADAKRAFSRWVTSEYLSAA